MPMVAAVLILITAIYIFSIVSWFLSTAPKGYEFITTTYESEFEELNEECKKIESEPTYNPNISPKQAAEFSFNLWHTELLMKYGNDKWKALNRSNKYKYIKLIKA